MTASLLVVQGRNQGHRIQLDRQPLELGRGHESNFRIADSEVSRNHAAIRPNASGEYELLDRGSSNGTFLNGQLTEQAILANGDHVQVGRTVLLFQHLADPGEWDAVTIAEQIHFGGDEFSRESIIAQVDAEANDAMISHVRSGAATVSALRRNLEVLHEVSELVVRPSVGIDELLQQILNLTLEAIGADRGVMLVADPQTDEIHPRVFGGAKATTDDGRMPISRTIVEYVLGRGRGVLTSDAAGDERFAGTESIVSSGIREAMCVPMHGRFELLGVIYVDTTQTPGESVLNGNRFTGETLTLLATIGRQAALAVENRRYQDALVKAERLAAIGQTVAMLSHHVKNILQGMRGGGYLVEKGLEGGQTEMAQRGWGILDRNQERLYNLVMDMLAFSKERTPELASCSLNEIVADVADLMRPAAAEQDVAIEIDLSEELLITLADREGLHRAVLNLVVNAIEAIDEGEDRWVRLRTLASGEHFAIEVADNGPGIPPEKLDSVFGMFESSKGTRGTGIGLAVSQKIMREHGGDIEVESEVGAGSCFRLLLPIRDEEASVSDAMRQTGEVDIPADLPPTTR